MSPAFNPFGHQSLSIYNLCTSVEQFPCLCTQNVLPPVHSYFLFYTAIYFIGGDFNRSPLTLNFVDERQDRRVRFPHPVNDNETELSEGFLFLLEVDGRITDPLDLSRLQILNNIILVVIEDDDGNTHTHTHTHLCTHTHTHKQNLLSAVAT